MLLRRSDPLPWLKPLASTPPCASSRLFAAPLLRTGYHGLHGCHGSRLHSREIRSGSNPRGGTPRPPAFAEPSAGRPATQPIPTSDRTAVLRRGRGILPRLCRPLPPSLARSLREPSLPSRFKLFRRSTKPPRMSRISRMPRIKFLHPC
jgi:hypothetical protein